MPRFRFASVDHDQLGGVVRAQHHAPLKPFIEDVGLSLWGIPGWELHSSASIVVLLDELYYIPIYLERAKTFDRIGCDVTVAGAGGTVARLGIYAADFNADGELVPGALTLDAGTVSVASSGDKEIVIDEALAAGFHFLAFSSDGTPTMRSPAPALALSTPVTTSSPTPFAQGNMILTVTLADGAAALPNPATAPDTLRTSQNALVMVRF